jgi:hypothetical protein
MTNQPLFPAAQAVLDATGTTGTPLELAARGVAAAALRAAAGQIQFEGQLGMTAYGGHAQAQSQLFAIAAELDNTSPALVVTTTNV